MSSVEKQNQDFTVAFFSGILPGLSFALGFNFGMSKYNECEVITFLFVLITCICSLVALSFTGICAASMEKSKNRILVGLFSFFMFLVMALCGSLIDYSNISLIYICLFEIVLSLIAALGAFQLVLKLRGSEIGN